MRKNAQSMVVKFVFGVIIVVFSFWGVGSMKARRMTLAATVNGESIDRKALDESFRNLWRNYQEQARGKFDPDEARIRQLKQEALNSLVDRRLLLKEAEKLGLIVSEEELRRRIAGLGAFQLDGRFDQESYRRALSFSRLTPAQFEAGLREDLLLDKLRQVIADGVKVLPEEVDILLRQQKEEIRLVMLRLDPVDFQALMPVDAEGMEKFFIEKRERFRIPEQRRIAAVVIERAQLLEQVVLAAGQAEKYYQDNLEKFQVDEQVKARHILIRVGTEAGAQELAEAQAEIGEIVKALKAGGDFAELAKKYSQDSTASKGGDLGWFGRGAMVAPFEEAAFALEPGVVSAPVRTDFGIHLIKCDERMTAHVKSFAEVKNDIEKGLRAEALPALLRQRLTEVVEGLAGSGPDDFIQAAGRLGLKVIKTPLFSQKDGVVPEIGRDPALLAEVFKTGTGETAELSNPTRNSYYFMVLERKDSYLPELVEVKESVEKAYRLEKAGLRVKELSEQVASHLEEGKTLEEAAHEIGAELQDSGYFLRGRGVIPKIGTDQQLSSQLFALLEGQTSSALRFRDSYLFARLDDRRLELGDDASAQKEEIRAQLLQFKGYRLVNEFVQHLRQEADVKIMAGVLD
ncbi:MAG: SurA N-terminal domain-containing protein [Deltaproteobacteria bacterium]|nr:SurA N-terminal domain-containing protein [Deltaproteobacteria bacterium]